MIFTQLYNTWITLARYLIKEQPKTSAKLNLIYKLNVNCLPLRACTILHINKRKLFN